MLNIRRIIRLLPFNMIVSVSVFDQSNCLIHTAGRQDEECRCKQDECIIDTTTSEMVGYNNSKQVTLDTIN